MTYVSNTSGSWPSDTIDYWPEQSSSTSVAVDAAGRVHIGYRMGGDLTYATNLSGSWVRKRVDGCDVRGSWTSLAVDATGGVHFGYYCYSNYHASGDLKVAVVCP